MNEQEICDFIKSKYSESFCYLESRILSLETKISNLLAVTTTTEQPATTVFDLAAYKAKLEQRLRECEAQYPTYTIDIMQARVAGQIDAYKHALRLLDA